MRTVAAFVATVLIAVPAGWHALGADIQTDGPATRPKQQTVVVDGVSVTIDLDRALLKNYGKVKLTLVGTSDAPTKVALEVRATEDMGYGEERVENPPKEISRKRITIEGAPGGGKPFELALELGDREKKGVVDWFDIVVRGLAPGSDSAKVGAATWSGNSYALAIEPPAVIPSTGPFTVAVRLTNTTKRALAWTEIDLGGPALNYGGLDSALYLGTGDDPTFKVERTDGTSSDEPIAPGASRVEHYEITPLAEGVKAFTLVAHAHGDGRGALEIHTFEVTPSAVAAQ